MNKDFWKKLKNGWNGFSLLEKVLILLTSPLWLPAIAVYLLIGALFIGVMLGFDWIMG